VASGRGMAYIGSSEKDITHGYFAVPPDTAYYIENTENRPLELDYVALRP
jgi:mannose-6-phosphate isomerase-like protein (cupin superfamily)